MRAHALLLNCLLAAAGIAPPLAAQQTPTISLALLDTGVIATPRITESSGVTASTRPGVYWTHNDSGDGPFLYALDSTAAFLGAVRVLGARNVDWEDLARATCPGSTRMCLFPADIGDNRGRRPSVVVYMVPEPVPPSGASDTLRTVQATDSIRLRYPDHPHDAEALAVTVDGLLLIVTKDLTGPARLFSAPLAGHGRDPVTLTPVCTLAINISALRGRVVTGAALSPDGRWLVLRTYVSLHVFALDAACTPLLPGNGLALPVVENQGEGIAFDGPDRLILTSEGGASGHAILTRLRIAGLPAR
jgi:hypothetical protein